MKVNFLSPITISIICLILSSCEETKVPVTGISLSETSLVVEVDSVAELTVNIEPPDASNKTLKWNSSDTTIAKVSSEGVITGISPGTVDINIESKDGFNEVCKVNVIKIINYIPYEGFNFGDSPFMALDNNDNLWHGIGWGGLNKLGFDGWGEGGYPINTQVLAIDFDSENNIWAATSSMGLLKRVGQTWHGYDTTNTEIPFNRGQAIAIDQNDNIWIGVSDGTIIRGGVSRFDGTNWKNYNSENGLVDNWVIKILVDKQNNIWVSTEKGLSMFNGSVWKSYLNDEEFNPNIVDMEVDHENNIWFVSRYDGVFMYDGSNMINYNTANSGIYSDRIQSIGIDAHGTKWFGHKDGVSKFNGTEWIHLTYHDYNLFDIRDIVVDSSGNKWFASPNKIYKLVD